MKESFKIQKSHTKTIQTFWKLTTDFLQISLILSFKKQISEIEKLLNEIDIKKAVVVDTISQKIYQDFI